MDVQTDHQIVSFPPDRMLLFDNESGNVVVTAERINGAWTVKADGYDDIQVPATPLNEQPRFKVIHQMCDLALEIHPHTGCSTTVPHGLWDVP
jgi:hypothetical protein